MGREEERAAPLAVCIALNSAESAEDLPEAGLGLKAVIGKAEATHACSWALSRFLST